MGLRQVPAARALLSSAAGDRGTIVARSQSSGSNTRRVGCTVEPCETGLLVYRSTGAGFAATGAPEGALSFDPDPAFRWAGVPTG